MNRYQGIAMSAAALAACATLAACAPGSDTTAGSGSGSGSGGQGSNKIEMAIDNAGPDYDDVYIAQDQGLFAKQGLSVSVQTVTGPSALAGMHAGNYQFAVFAATEVVNAAASGAPVTDIADVENKYPYELFAQPSITSPSQLKGARVGITTQGTATALGADYALTQLGVSPGDVGFVSTGSVANLNAALLSKSVTAGVAHPPASLALQKKGLKVLYDLRSNAGTTALSLVVDPNYMKSHRDTVQKMVTAITQAAKIASTNKNAVSEAIKKHVTQVSSASQIPPTTNFYMSMANYPPTPDPKDFVAAQKDLSAKNSGVSQLNLSQFVDPSFVEQAVKGSAG